MGARRRYPARRPSDPVSRGPRQPDRRVMEKIVRPVRDASRASGYPRDGIYEAIADGRLPVIRRGRRILVPMQRLEQMIAEEIAAAEMPKADEAHEADGSEASLESP